MCKIRITRAEGRADGVPAMKSPRADLSNLLDRPLPRSEVRSGLHGSATVVVQSSREPEFRQVARLAPFYGNTSQPPAGRVVERAETVWYCSALWSSMMIALAEVMYASDHIRMICAGQPIGSTACFRSSSGASELGPGTAGGERELRA